MKRAFFLTMIFLLNGSWLLSQVAISADGSTPHATAVLDLQSTNQGFLLPRLTTNQQMNIDGPASGLMVYNLDSNDIYFYNGSYWLSLRNLTDTIQTWSCGDPLTDTRDAQVYATIQTGTQCWMAQNLDVGARINGNTAQSDNGTIEKYCYNDLPANCNTYGGLYQWNEMMQYTTTPGLQGICPDGWHVPSEDEWFALTDYVSSQSGYWCGGYSTYIGKSLSSTTYWLTSPEPCDVGNDPATNNATGFSGLPGGYRLGSGGFDLISEYGYWWTSTGETIGANAWLRNLSYLSQRVLIYDYNKVHGFSVRCLRD